MVKFLNVYKDSDSYYYIPVKKSLEHPKIIKSFVLDRDGTLKYDNTPSNTSYWPENEIIPTEDFPKKEKLIELIFENFNPKL
jgi:hypothetical protein